MNSDDKKNKPRSLPVSEWVNLSSIKKLPEGLLDFCQDVFRKQMEEGFFHLFLKDAKITVKTTSENPDRGKQISYQAAEPLPSAPYL